MWLLKTDEHLKEMISSEDLTVSSVIREFSPLPNLDAF